MSLFSWVRRNSRKAIALALGPGLIALALDAYIAHFMGKDSDNPYQYIPVVYGVVAFVLLTAVALPKVPRGAFAFSARLLGAVGFVVGIAGTVFHIIALKKALEGDWSWANIQGTLPDSPPLFAPLGFTGLGALIYILASKKILLRLNVGSKRKAAGDVVTLPSDRTGRQTG